jgi:hypothetical protein
MKTITINDLSQYATLSVSDELRLAGILQINTNGDDNVIQEMINQLLLRADSENQCWQCGAAQ